MPAEEDEDVTRTGVGPARTVRWRGAAVPLLAVVPVVAALVLALTGGAGTEGARGGPTTTTTEAASAAPPLTAPVGPGADPALTGGGDASFSFDEAAPGLPPVVDGRSWREDAGTWSSIDGRVVGVADDAGALASFDAGARDLRMEVALPDAYDSTGLAFSIEDGSYLLWGPAEGFPTIALYRVTAGQVAFVLHSERSALGPGLRVGVHIRGSRVELLAGGAVVATYEDTGSSARVGLAVGPGQAFGTFDDLVVDLP